MKLGSQSHKELFCQTFLDGHRTYAPQDLPWPHLDGDALALMRSIPFWTHALQAEEDAGPMINAVAALEADPLLRRALELQAHEETRHARVIRHMIRLYDLPADEVHADVPEDVLQGFIDFGFEECLDSFGAFGLFKLAREHLLVPEPLFAIFDQVMQEEAHHIVFFVNWFAHRQVNLGGMARALHQPKALWHYGRALRKLYGLMRDDDAPEGKDFVVTGATAFMENLTPKLVISASLSENARRLAGFDRRLVVPRLAPRLARIALTALDLLPHRSSKPPGTNPAASTDRPAENPRAA